MSNVRVRFAPSPTGFLHIGGLRTALYNYLFARHHQGSFILRIEDTDQNRLGEGAIENLVSSLQKLGMDFDEGPNIGGDKGPYIQSQRLDFYHKYANQLINQGDAYYCFCSPERLDELRKKQLAAKHDPKYDRHCLLLTKKEINQKIESGEKHVIRLKMPDKRLFSFEDLIRGKVEIDASQLDDQVIIKSDGFPTYHLAAVIDDHLMEISHVIRGEEWLSSTPKHIWLNECLGFKPPIWVHLPLILNPDRCKLSKRMNDVSVEDYLEKGYLKEAILNFIALLGWHPLEDKEIFTLSELIQKFSLERVNKAGAIFDLNKLDWMNGYYIRTLPVDYIAELCKPYFERLSIDISDNEKYKKVIASAVNHMVVLPDVINHSLMYYQEFPIHEDDVKHLATPEAQKVLQWYLIKLQDVSVWNKDVLHELVIQGMNELQIKGKNYYHPIRIALFYSSSGRDIPTILDILGKEEAIRRITKCLKKD